MSVLIVIPARMKATRLPGKPLALVGGVPMIVQVAHRAAESGIGDIIVACDGEEIAAAVQNAGYTAVITNPDHPSGSDRIWEAVQAIENGSLDIRNAQTHPSNAISRVAEGEPEGGRAVAGAKRPPYYNIIINLQGDVPTLEPHLLNELLAPLANPAVDISTLAARITRNEEHDNPSVVKAVIAFDKPEKTGRALYFTRCTAPHGDGPRYHHIGVYAYRRAALEKFVSLPPSALEQREKLEQLRALEAGLRIDVQVVDTVPLGVDTPEDLERANEFMKRNA